VTHGKFPLRNETSVSTHLPCCDVQHVTMQHHAAGYMSTVSMQDAAIHNPPLRAGRLSQLIVGPLRGRLRQHVRWALEGHLRERHRRALVLRRRPTVRAGHAGHEVRHHAGWQARPREHVRRELHVDRHEQVTSVLSHIVLLDRADKWCRRQLRCLNLNVQKAAARMKH